MSLVTVVWSMIAAACLTLAAVHLPVWWRNREARATLAFSLAAICTAAIALLRAGHAQGADAGRLRRGAALDEPAGRIAAGGARRVRLITISMRGLRWLAVTAIALRLVSLVINFTVGESGNFLHVTSLRSVPLLGEQVVDGRRRAQSLAGDRSARRLPADAVLHRRIGARVAARSTRRRRAGRRQPHVLHGWRASAGPSSCPGGAARCRAPSASSPSASSPSWATRSAPTCCAPSSSSSS